MRIISSDAKDVEWNEYNIIHNKMFDSLQKYNI